MNHLIREALIEGRTSEEKYEKDGYAVRWTLANDLELIFVVCISFVLEWLYGNGTVIAVIMGHVS